MKYVDKILIGVKMYMMDNKKLAFKLSVLQHKKIAPKATIEKQICELLQKKRKNNS
jgi:hypothetical protein